MGSRPGILHPTEACRSWRPFASTERPAPRSLQVYEIKPLRAWGAVATTLASMAGCLWLIAQAPWYMLPFAWALAGTAFTGVRTYLPISV